MGFSADFQLAEKEKLKPGLCCPASFSTTSPIFGHDVLAFQPEQIVFLSPPPLLLHLILSLLTSLSHVVTRVVASSRFMCSVILIQVFYSHPISRFRLASLHWLHWELHWVHQILITGSSYWSILWHVKDYIVTQFINKYIIYLN